MKGLVAMPITRRDLLASGAALSMAVVLPPAAVASSVSPMTGEQALARLGAEGLVPVLTEGYQASYWLPADRADGYERFLRHVGPASRIAFARGQATFHGLANAIDARRLIKAIDDETLPEELREGALSAFSDTPGFDPSLGLRQPTEVLDIHEYVAMRACLLLARLEFNVAPDDLARGRVDWTAMDV